MFNRTYQVRATRRAILAEVHKGFYRPPGGLNVRDGGSVPVLSADEGLVVRGGRRGQRSNDQVRSRLDARQLSLSFPLTERELAEDFAATFS
jgi:hypothetical protein